MTCPKCSNSFKYVSLQFSGYNEPFTKGFFCPYCGIRLKAQNKIQIPSEQEYKIFYYVINLILSAAAYICTKYFFGLNVGFAIGVSTSVLAIDLMIAFAVYKEKNTEAIIDESWQYSEPPKPGKKPESILKSILRLLLVFLLVFAFFGILVYLYIIYAE